MYLKIKKNGKTVGLFGGEHNAFTTLRIDVAGEPQICMATAHSYQLSKDQSQVHKVWDLGEIDSEISIKLVESGDAAPPTSVVKWQPDTSTDSDGFWATTILRMRRKLTELRRIGDRPLDSCSRSSEKLINCSFCGKSQLEIRKMIAGPSVHICDECVVVCTELVLEEFEQATG